MKLKEQLDLLQGKYVKLGSKMSFIYCEICDKNIYKTLEKLGVEELERIEKIKLKTEEQLKTFDQEWKDRKKRRVDQIKKAQKCRLEIEIKRELQNIKLVDSVNKNKTTEKEIEKIKKEIQKKLKQDFELEIKEVVDKTNEDRRIAHEKLKNKYSMYLKYKKEFEPFLEREVLEVYDSILEENCKIVRFTGNELGRYWDREEYNNRKKRRLKK